MNYDSFMIIARYAALVVAVVITLGLFWEASHDVRKLKYIFLTFFVALITICYKAWVALSAS